MFKRARSRLLPKRIIDTEIKVDTDIFPNQELTTHFIQKPSGEVVNNSTAFQNDDDFFFTVGVDEIHEIEFVLKYDGGATADFKWELSLPSGATFRGISHSLTDAAALGSDDRISVVTEVGHSCGALGAGTAAALHIKGMVETTDTGGTVRFRWAQRAAVATDTTLQANSYMMRRQIA